LLRDKQAKPAQLGDRFPGFRLIAQFGALEGDNFAARRTALHKAPDALLEHPLMFV